MAWLVALDGELAGKWFALEAPLLVGRGPLNHVVLDDPRVSRQHAKISPEAGGFVVYDLNSANGTFVAEEPTKRAKLEPGMVVRFGPFHFRFEAQGRAARATTPKPFGGMLEIRTEIRTRSGIDTPLPDPPAVTAEAVPEEVKPDADRTDKVRRDERIINALEVADDGQAEEVTDTTGLTILEDAHRKLSTLYAFMKSISTTLVTSELVDRIISNLFDVFSGAAAVSIYLRDTGGEMEPLRSVGRDGLPINLRALSPQQRSEVVRLSRAILSGPALLETAANKRNARAQRGLAMHAPMVYHGAVQGVIVVRAIPGDDGFARHDLDLLAGLAALAAVTLSNARMHAESLKQQRLERDLLLAKEIQKSFLPRSLPEVPGLAFFAEYLPAFSIGGDFYDLFWIDDQRLGLFIGDVAGKGVSAALLMARISNDLRVAARADSDPARVLQRVNAATLEREQPEVFVTGIYLTMDARARKVVLANAGHLPPYLRRRSGIVELLDAGSCAALGFFDDSDYEQVELSLNPGDALVLCTDGVLEAQNDAGEQFGAERMMASLAAAPPAAAELGAHLLADLRTHVGDAAQYDDLTLIACSVSDSPDRK